jgi:spermidine/putrescine transport system permease protein
MSNSSAPGNNLTRRFLAGWTYFILAFLYLPIVLLIIYSFNNSEMTTVWRGFSTRWYSVIGHDAALLDGLENSLIIAAITTAVSIVLGTGAAWMLHRYRFAGAGTITTLAVLPMILPEIIMGISLMLLFRAVSMELGFTTVIIAHVTFCFPFVMAAVQARLIGLDPSLQEAAMDLGATPLVAFFRVIVPYLLPGIIAGGMLSFILSIDEFIVTFFTTSAASQTLPIVIYGRIKTFNPEMNAVSALIVAATVVLAIAADVLHRRNRT